MIRKRKQKKKVDPLHQHQAQQLKKHCKQVWAYFRNNPSGKFFSIVPRPWILVLGTPKSGKTTLLSSAGLSLTSPHQRSLKAAEPTKLVDWWIGKEAVFIDPSSEIALPSNAIEQIQWETLLKTVKTYCSKRPIHQILIVIDLPSLINLSNNTIEKLTEQLQAVQKLSKIIPVSIVISKCDKLLGFSAMFDDLNEEQRHQIFGTHFTNKDRETGLTSAFDRSLSTIIDRLKSRLIHRLHRELSMEKRRQIFRFTTEPASIAKPIKNLLTSLPFSNTIPLYGIYFTSSDHHRVYFINDMMKSIIQQSKLSLPVTSRYAAERLLAFPIAAAIIFGLTLAWHTGYNQTIHIINTVQENLALTPKNLPQHMPWLTELNILGKVSKTIDQQQTIPYKWLGLLQTDQINKIVNEKYKSLLVLQFKPYIESTLLSQMHLGMKGDKLALFDALKAYLSLSQDKYYNKDIISNWYRIYWKALYPKNPELQDQLHNHLSMLLKSDKPLLKPNKTLIQQARNVLQKLSLSDLAFLELQGEYKSINVPIFENGDLEGVSLNKATVPAFFSTTNVNDILKHKIPAIGKILAKGNWVLGTTTGKKISTEQQTKIAKKIRELYLSYYTNVWADTISNVKLEPADNFTDIFQRINSVTNSKSKFSQLLKLIISNTKLDGGTSNKNLKAVNDYLNKSGRYVAINKVLGNLKSSLEKIKNSDHGNKLSYLMAKKRFHENIPTDLISRVFDEANNNPEPIKSWLNTIALSSWKVILKQTRNYLNTVWNTIVLPTYYDEIDNRYPVFKDASDNITIKSFNEFFGPNGAITAFFIYYLQDFVNTTKNYWTWKTLNGKSLGIPQNTLNSFIRASIIQQMFFSDNKNKIGFQFALSPISLSGNLKKLILNVGGQIYPVVQKNNASKQFNWPGHNPNLVTIQFITNDDDNPTETYSGPWSWFRMLDANTLQTTSNPAKFTLTMQSNSHSASFNLIANHRINPMVPGVIGKFRCPDTL